jgi:chromosome segregation ATPase
MAQPSKASPEAITAAISALVARGTRVTLQSVRDEIGGGSLGTIQPVLKAWRGEQDQAARTQAAQATPAYEEAPSVPIRVSQALDAGRHGLDAIAGAVAEAINAAVSDERRRGRLELDTEREGWERRLSAAQDQARAADDETAQVAADAAIIEAERDELAERLALARAETERLSAALATAQQAQQEARAEATTRAAENEALQQAVVQAQARAVSAEREQRAAEARATAAEAAVERLTVERDQARQDLSGEKGRAEQLSERLKVERADLTARIQATTGERDQAQERVRAAEAQAAELRGELAALRKR